MGRFITDFDDEILTMEWKATERDTGELENYRARAECFVHDGVVKNLPVF